jgi:acetyl-CoA C-acetyltransferase
MSDRDVFIVSAVRTAIGTFGGSLRDTPPAELATQVARAALQRAGCEPEHIEHVVFGHVIPTVPQDAYIARVAALQSAIPNTTPAFVVNRLCGSGLQALISAAQIVKSNDAQIVLAGGVESMSRSGYLASAARWGARMGDTQLQDLMLGALQDPIHRIHMGITAENVAASEGISRKEQDQLALLSQQRAARAIREGRFRSQIVPIQVKRGKLMEQFDVDEHVRDDVTLERLAGMKPAFKPDGTVTAGNSSGLNDGASALVLASELAIKRDGLRPLARVVSYAHAGVEPTLMGLGPISASRLALQRAGLKVADMDVIESNEAFAAQACAVSKSLEFDPEKVNPNGSGIALGHPVGASGAIICTKAVHELQRINGRYALVTMCIGGGQGIAVVLERV